MSQCSRCLLDLNLHPVLESGICPNCGQKTDMTTETGATAAGMPTFEGGSAPVAPVAPVGPGASLTLFTRFWQTLRDVIFRPSEFFSANAALLLSDESLSSALAFAVIVQWVASFFNFMWRLTVGAALESRLDDMFRIAGDVIQNGPGTNETLDQLRSKAVEFLFGAGAIVLTPFTTLLKLALSALLVHAAVRFFFRDEPGRQHRYSTTLKILSYATGPWVLCVIPGVGLLLGYVLAFVAAVVGLREVYRTTTTRAVVAVAFPEILFLAFILGLVVLMLFLAFNVLRLVS